MHNLHDNVCCILLININTFALTELNVCASVIIGCVNISALVTFHIDGCLGSKVIVKNLFCHVSTLMDVGTFSIF